MSLILAILAVALVAWLVYAFVRDYRAATGTAWQRMIAAAHDSATKLWSRFVMLLGAATGVLTGFADYLGDPGLSEAIKSVLKPEYVAIFTVAVAFITILARNRTMPPKG